MKRKTNKLFHTCFILIVICLASLSIGGNNIKTYAMVNPVAKDYNLQLNYKKINSNLGLVGRWFKKDINGVPHYVTLNDGSQIFFKVKGTKSIYINFTVITNKETPYFAYSIDGGNPIRQLITDPLIAFNNDGEHVVRIIVDGMTEKEDKWKGEIGVALRSIDTGYGKTTGILPTNKLIAFYGDSITEGIRALNMNLNSNGNSATNTYVWNCCANLKTVPYFIGFGGSGITKAGTFNTCIKAIDYFSATRKAEKISPDIIVINHGTNDTNADSDTFKNGYNKVLEKLHKQHKYTPIVCMIPFNQTHAQDIRDCVTGKSYCYLIETQDWNLTYTDTKHPNVSGAEKAGRLLSDKLTELFGADILKAF